MENDIMEFNWNDVKIQDLVGSRKYKKYTTDRIKMGPCDNLGYCPYGYLVEFFPLEERDEYSCMIFGHDCPVYYLAEGFIDEEDALSPQEERVRDCSKEVCNIEE